MNSPRTTRRLVLKGLGGATLGLPLFESVGARAQVAPTDTSFAIFFRQPNGVATAQNTVAGQEPERFWPRQVGALTQENVAGRPLDELGAYLSRLLLVKVNTTRYNLGEQHARSAIQCLTGIGPTNPDDGTSSLANGESIDHRIGRELNPGGRDSLCMYSGRIPGFLGGPCISYRGPGQRRAPFASPWLAFQYVTGGGGSAARTRSLNDLVRAQLLELQGMSVLSTSDRQKLDLHLTNVRELELNLSCTLAEDQARLIETGSGLYESDNGEDRIRITELHMDVAALAISCGQNRSVAIQFGSGNDGNTRFLDPDSGNRMENYHFVSHRIYADGNDGPPIPGADLLHHHIDRYFAKMFKHLLDRLSAYSMPTGGSLLDHGLTIWFNDLGNGPGHSADNIPWLIAGSANGALKQGQYIVPSSGSSVNHPRLLATLGAAVGVKNANNTPLDTFGDPQVQQGQLPELFA